ncbi:MAG TPA: hypothetical protein VJ739_17840 [Gemmataceae bacterium]|nr:hypothetical protein [Gemmataceae bacterium]
MRRLLACAGLLTVLTLVSPLPAADKDDEPDNPKAALESFNDFIGGWKGSGARAGARPGAAGIWNETLNWRWGFKGDDAWLVLTVKNGKYFKGGELHYLPEKKVYQFTLTDRAGKKQAFTGAIKDDVLVLEHVDPKTKETQQIKMNTAAEGIRLIYSYAHKPAGRTLFVKDYRVDCNKEGESLGAAEKKVECVVTGGLGTMPVSYKGVTYYVCCSGCRDAFMENPEKYIKEFEARKKGKK